MVNHIPGEYAFFNKEPWLHYVRNYSRDYQCDYTRIHPETYALHNVAECYSLMRLGPTTKRSAADPIRINKPAESPQHRENSFWFWKPPGGSFGRGVRVGTMKEIRYAASGLLISCLWLRTRSGS